MDGTHGRIWWSELWTRDPAGASDYYGSIAGWTYNSMDMDGGPYHMASANGVPVAGIMNIAGLPGMDEVPPHWFTYIAVDDVDAAVAVTLAAAGEVIRTPWDVPGVGRIAIVRDPTGAAVGIMTPKPRAG